jgi:hypothetical protein
MLPTLVSMYKHEYMENIIKQTLTQASEGLLFPSESDYPFEYVEWPDNGKASLTKKVVRKMIAKPDDTPVRTVSLDRFFKPVTEVKDWYGEEEKAATEKFIALKKIIENNLTNVKVFRVGEIEIDVFITGKSASGQWAGLATKVIET